MKEERLRFFQNSRSSALSVFSIFERIFTFSAISGVISLGGFALPLEDVFVSLGSSPVAEAMKSGKENWCPPPTDKPKPNVVPEIYYASVDQNGSTEWVFCDELRVMMNEGAKPELVLEDPKKKPKNAKGYLDSAAKYPASEVQHAPKPGDANAADGGLADAGTPAQG